LNNAGSSQVCECLNNTNTSIRVEEHQKIRWNVSAVIGVFETSRFIRQVKEPN
jgi:hypothetical protein